MSLSQYIVIGRYIPIDSFLHRLDVRTKIIFVTAFVILIFMADNYIEYGILTLSIILGIIISKIPIKVYVKGIIPIVWIIIFTVILHVFTTTGGELIYEWKWIKIYSYGVEQAFYISIRLLLIVVCASMLTLTTAPMEITKGLEIIMKPLKKLKVPVSEIALMMSIALRFIPTLLDEADRIIKTQKARGVEFGSGSIYKRALNITSIIIPLFISSFKRADELAIAMEARGYRGGITRSSYNILTFTSRDVLFLILLVLLISIIVIL